MTNQEGKLTWNGWDFDWLLYWLLIRKSLLMVQFTAELLSYQLLLFVSLFLLIYYYILNTENIEHHNHKKHLRLKKTNARPGSNGPFNTENLCKAVVTWVTTLELGLSKLLMKIWLVKEIVYLCHT